MTFTPEIYAEMAEGCRRSAARIVPRTVELVQPRTVCDIGGGTGEFAREFARAGCRVLALDESVTAWRSEENSDDSAGGWVGFDHVDLTSGDWPTEALLRVVALGMGPKAELAVCLEVAEHLPAEAADLLVRGLCALAPVVLFSAAIPGQGGLGHCFPAQTKVSGPAAQRGFARSYKGEVIEITFASGEFLTATAEHPILTSQGWVAARLLDEGSHVFRRREGQRVTVGIPDDCDVPTPIEEVAAAAGIAEPMLSVGVKGTAENLDIDREDAEIAVIGTDRLLSDGAVAERGQHPSELLLAFGRSCHLELPRGGAASEGFFADGPTLSAGHQRVDDSLSSFGRATRRRQAVHLLAASHQDVPRSQAATHGRTRDPEAVSEFLRGLPFEVSTDEIVRVDRHFVSGLQVYNLQTGPGWYLADGVIVHNCNEQWPAYWADLFGRHGRVANDDLRGVLWDDAEVEPWYRQNLLLYATPDWMDERALPYGEPYAVVHPDLFAARVGERDAAWAKLRENGLEP